MGAELMKGKVWGEHKHKLKYPVIAEVKYDEIRVHVKRVPKDKSILGDEYIEFLSYAGKPLNNLGRFANAFLMYMQKANLYELDCGVEVNGNFNDSYRWVRSKCIPTGLEIEMVRWLLFDAPDHAALPYYERRWKLDKIRDSLVLAYGLVIHRPLYKVCYTESDVDYFFAEMRGRGLEGLMVKTLDHTYQKGKRIDGWLKMKPEETADGRITAINQAFAADGSALGRAGSVDVVLEDGSTASPAGIEWGLARAMWERPQEYIGQWCEFKYMEVDRAGGYRHPSVVRLREAK